MPAEGSKLIHHVFVYGTLKKGEPNHHVLNENSDGRFEFIGEAKTLNKFPLIIASKYNIPFLLDITGKDSCKEIYGEIYVVDDAMLKSLDDLENHPHFYVRRIESVQLLNDNNQHLSCWIYFLPTFRPDLLNLPTYSNYSSNGDHGLPYVPRYRRTIENYSPMNDVLNRN